MLFFSLFSDQHAITVVYLMLQDLGGKAVIGLHPQLHPLVLKLYLDRAVPFAFFRRIAEAAQSESETLWQK